MRTMPCANPPTTAAAVASDMCRPWQMEHDYMRPRKRGMYIGSQHNFGYCAEWSLELLM